MTPTQVAKAVRSALASSPCSVRALAKEAGLSPALLSMIESGDRNATPQTARALADALDRWSARCASAARAMRQAAGKEAHD